MKTIEISDALYDQVVALSAEARDALLLDAAGQFMDITSVNTPGGERWFRHALTGARLVVRGAWEAKG